MGNKTKKIVTWVLRIGAFGVFLGHGIVALQGNMAWIPLLTNFGFSTNMATKLLPVIGAFDVFIAFMLLLFPIRIILMWACFWAFATALARPLSGLPVWAFVERTGNWAIPLALLLHKGLPKNIKDLFRKY